MPPPPPATTGDTRVAPDPLAATAGYWEWGWPVTLRRDQIRLNLDGDALALIIPVLLATEVTAILATRRAPGHWNSAAPTHRDPLRRDPLDTATRTGRSTALPRDRCSRGVAYRAERSSGTPLTTGPPAGRRSGGAGSPRCR
jgi:hypothetical protein